MELTTSYQMLGQKYLGNSYGDLYIRIYAKWSEQDIPNNRTKVQYQARGYYSGSSYILDQQSNGNVKGTSASQTNFSRSSSYSSGETILGTTEAWVTHNSDGTMSISASAYLNLPNWGWNGTASGTATLPNLHKAPEINVATMVEKNNVLIALNIPNTTIVRYLSKKTITLSVTTYDNATPTYRLRHFNTDYALPSSTTYQNSNVFNTDYTQHDFTITNGKANLIQDIKDSLNGVNTDWVYVNINGTAQKPNVIAYTKPTLEKTSTTIKRKSGNGTNLTDNKANINLVGTFYKANDVIGNNNSITKIGYKVWQDRTSEPTNYTTLTPTISGGNVTVTNYEISNIDFTKIYNYKIILQDNYSNGTTNYSDIITGTIPLGQPTWTEYKDRVDFLNATIGGNSIVESGTNYIKYYDGTMICWNKTTTSTLTWSQDNIIYYSANLTLPNFAKEFISAPTVLKTIQNTNTSRMIWITGNSAPTTTSPGTYNLATYWNATNTNVTVSYIAIGKWK